MQLEVTVNEQRDLYMSLLSKVRSEATKELKNKKIIYDFLHNRDAVLESCLSKNMMDFNSTEGKIEILQCLDLINYSLKSILQFLLLNLTELTTHGLISVEGFQLRLEELEESVKKMSKGIL